MKFNLIILFYIVFLPKIFGQTINNNYTVNIGFSPSFLLGSKLVIKTNSDSSVTSLSIFNKINKTAVLKNNGIKPLTDFLEKYTFKLIDTVGAPVNFEILSKINMGYDGITVNIDLTQNNIIKRNRFWSPEENTENTKLVNLLFQLMNNAFKDKESVNYLELLEQYFPHKLGLKKLSDHPLTYKLYGSISSSEAGEFNNFLVSLPSNKEVIIDMSNYLGMGTMFYDDIKDCSDRIKKLYWLNPTNQGLVDLHNIGISKKKIISSQKIEGIDKNGK